MGERETPTTVDVVVVGSGGAGLTAAIAAADHGARVLVLERSDKFGGTTAYSGGKVWVPNNHHMRRLGIPDSEEGARAYLERTTGNRYPRLISAFLTQAPRMAEYLEANTPLKFYPCVNYPDYHPEWVGATRGGRALDAMPFEAEVLGEYAGLVRRSPAFMPITHAEWEQWRSPLRFDRELIGRRIRTNVLTTGTAIVGALLKGCLDRGILLSRRHRAVRLVIDGGRVCGLEVESPSGRLTITARRGVILACGGFEWNRDLVDRFLRVPIRGAASPPWNEGDGLVMGAAVGAQLSTLGEAWWMPLLRVPGEEADGQPFYRAMIGERGLPGSIIVNRRGCRFANEALNYNDFMLLMGTFDPTTYERPNIPAFFIFDERFRRRYPIAKILPGEAVPEWVARARSPRELAEKLGIDPEGLEQTLERFNRFARRGVDPDFHRGESAYDRYYGDPAAGPNPNLAPIEEPPFFGLEVIPGVIGTKGGLETDERARVLNVWGDVIPGLYACGNLAAFWLGPGYPGPGASLGPGMTFGFIAGLDAARAS